MSSLSFSGGKASADITRPLVSETPNAEVRAVVKTTKEFVREFFVATPILAEIARCESQFRQHDKAGRALRGTVNPKDVGVMQINELYHGERAKSLGYDIYSLEGNLAYAKWLYEREGGNPWSASGYCWGRGSLSIGI